MFCCDPLRCAFFNVIHSTDVNNWLTPENSLLATPRLIVPGKVLTYSCLILVVFILLSSANHLNNIVVVVMVKMNCF